MGLFIFGDCIGIFEAISACVLYCHGDRNGPFRVGDMALLFEKYREKAKRKLSLFAALRRRAQMGSLAEKQKARPQGGGVSQMPSLQGRFATSKAKRKAFRPLPSMPHAL